MGKHCYLQATVESQFLKDVVHMALDCVCCNVQPLGNLLVAETFGNQCYDLAFALRHPDRIGQRSLPVLECVLDDMRKKGARQRGGKDFCPAGTALEKDICRNDL